MTIGEGIMQGVQQFGAGLNNYADGIAKAKALRQVLSAYAPEGEAGDATRHLAATGSLPELEGAVQSFAVKNEQAQRQQQMALLQARVNDYTAQANQRTQSAQNADEEANAASQYIGGLHQIINNPNPNDPRQVEFAKSVPDAVKYNVQALAQMGKTNPRAAAPMIKQVMGYFADPNQTAKKSFFQPTDMGQEVPGFAGLYRIPTGPNTSELRDKNGAVATQVTDNDGNVIGHSIPNGNGTAKFTPKNNQGNVTDRDKFAQQARAHAERVKAASEFLKTASPNDRDYNDKLAAYNGALKEQDDFLRSGTTTAAAPVQEVMRITKDGRQAIYDAASKKFLRYAN